MRGVLLLALLLGACSGGDGADADLDGFTADVDCDDDDASINPSEAESCDGVDNDCDGNVDEADNDVVDALAYFADGDDDGVGGAPLGSYCSAPLGGVATSGDCDDSNQTINPSAQEVCDGVDNDCDQAVDIDDDSVQGGGTWFRDGDDDGYGSNADFVSTCEAPEGYVAQGDDCDDGDADRNPGAPEICDGKDNNCDIASGLLVDDADPAYVGNTGTQYLDDDVDGVGGDTVIAGCEPEYIGKLVAVTGDCDDADDAIFPGAPEGCDAVDNDCDGTVGDNEWSRDDAVYRIAIDVTGSSAALVAPPISVDLNLAQAMVNGEVPAPSTYRIVRASCSAGYPAIPGEFADPSVGFFAPGEPITATGAGMPYWGMLGFRYDRDGNWATADTLAAGATDRFYLYWSATTRGGGSPPFPAPPAMTVGTVAAPSTDNGTSTFALDPTKGGLLSALGLVGGDNVGAQTANVFGNGVYATTADGTAGGWLTAVNDTTPTISSIHQGRMMSIWQAKGDVTNAYGGMSYTYTFLMFNGRPEVYVKATLKNAGFSRVTQGPGWSTGIRPFQIDNNALVTGTSTGAADAGNRWVRSAYASDSKGVFLAWRTLPLGLSAPVTAATGRWLGLTGQDLDADLSGAGHDLSTNATLVNGRVLMVMPYTGTWASVDDTALALMQGVTTSVGAAELR